MRVVLVLLLVLGSPNAHADQGYRVAVATTEVAFAAVALFAGKAFEPDSNARFWVGFAGFAGMVLGPPIVHGAVGNYGRMGVSFVAHTVLPAVGVTAERRTSGGRKGGTVGFMLGSLVATIIDVAIASSDDDPATARVFSIGARF